MTLIGPNYCAELNSDDKHDGDLPLFNNKSYGGTMTIWKKTLDKYISLPPVSSSSFLPIVFAPPGSPASIHIGIYLPTSGKEAEFFTEITQLHHLVTELQDKYHDCLVYIRGDSNVNVKNKDRNIMFSSFLNLLNLKSVPVLHNTYHHFIGDGLFDSNIDVIITSDNANDTEQVTEIICKHENYLIESHHDIILSSLKLPVYAMTDNQDGLVKAPQIPNSRVKIVWEEIKIPEYQQQVSTKLASLRSTWPHQPSLSQLSILLELSNTILSQAAMDTNKHIKLGHPKHVKKPCIPRPVRKAQFVLKMNLKILKSFKHSENHEALEAVQNNVKEARRQYKYLTRRFHYEEDLRRDSATFKILSSTPSGIFKSIKSTKSSTNCQIPFLSVGSKIYPDVRVSDGFYDSLTRLKTQDKEALFSSQHYQKFAEEYKFILKICQDKKVLPQISISDSNKILLKMRPHVNDLFSITANHYINAGPEGLLHFNYLLNIIIHDVNLASADELNAAYALLLHKGHRKPKTSERSYRTISTCPFLSKALDMYLNKLYISRWNSLQAPTQFQGTGSSHELAALLLTEVILHSAAAKEPLFLLFLDAKSAFDTVVTEFLVRYLYLSGVDGDALLLLNQRLVNRKTYVDWDRTIMGPIVDEHGVEQGGVNSSELYKLYNNELLNTLQNSGQGVKLNCKLTVSAVGQADDVVICSNNIYMLYNLVQLALAYCRKLNVTLCADKTKLLLFADSLYSVPLNPIQINHDAINVTDEAEHVGILRSTRGNLPNIMCHIQSFKQATGAILSHGLARGHRSNPAACIRVLNIYGLPVLMSCLGSLLLNPKEVSLIHQHHKTLLQQLQKLHVGTPQSFIYFMAGSLPATAILHVRQLSIFGMICRLPGTLLHSYAHHVLTTCKPRTSSWFARIRSLCLQYSLPHPLTFLEAPLSKAVFKKLIKSKVMDYWEQKLRLESRALTSLVYFDPRYMSLARPHPIWWTAGSNPYEVSKAVIQCRMLSGRYRTYQLTSHWSDNKAINCPSPICQSSVETLEHLLLHCPAYTHTRLTLLNKWKGVEHHSIQLLITSILTKPSSYFMQFLLDASVLPETRCLVRTTGVSALYQIFSLTRTWCYSIHRERLKVINSLKND